MADRVLRECLAAGVGGAIADGIFNPLTVLQVRAQLQPGVGMIQLTRSAIAHAGIVQGLWAPGLLAISMRAMSYSGCRVGLYPTVRDALPGGGFGTKVAAGGLTGFFGATVFAPIEVVRVRMVGATPYQSTLRAFEAIICSDGLLGLWRSVGPFAVRAAMYSSTQLATYETFKHKLLASGAFQSEGVGTHFAASLMSGVCASLVAHPVDTLKTVAMEARGRSLGSLGLFLELIAAGGIARLYAGLGPALLSKGPMIMVYLPLVEQLRARVFGLGYI